VKIGEGKKAIICLTPEKKKGWPRIGGGVKPLKGFLWPLGVPVKAE